MSNDQDHSLQGCPLDIHRCQGERGKVALIKFDGPREAKMETRDLARLIRTDQVSHQGTD